MKVLLVDGNSEIANILTFTLKIRWTEVSLIHVYNGAEGIGMVESEFPDIVFLGDNITDSDVFDVLKQIRSFSDVPIIFITGVTDEMNRVRGLESGADDYIENPFSPLDLLARVNAVLRRSGMRQLEELPAITTANLSINFAKREVLLDGEYVHLTPTEYRILCHLVRNEGRVVMKQALLRVGWADDVADVDYSMIKKYIYQLRSKLGDNTSQPQIIVNERGVGYKFVRPA